MKKGHYFLAISLFLLAFVTSCDKEAKDCTASSTGNTVTFSYNKATSVFQSCNPDLQATVSKIYDSRCPTGLVCVWAGTVSVVLQMDSQFSITLDIGKQKDSVYQNQKYSFLLVDVTPYPSYPPTSNEPKVVVTITKQ